MNTLFSKSAQQMTLKVLFLLAFTANSRGVIADDHKVTNLTDKKKVSEKAKITKTKPRKNVAKVDKGTLGVTEKDTAEAGKGTIGKGSPAESTVTEPGIERAHAAEEEPAAIACERITKKAALLGRLASKDPSILENEANLQLDSFEAKKFYQEPLREYLNVVVSTLAVLEKSRIEGQWNPQLREQQTRLTRIRNEMSKEIAESSQEALAAKGCSVLKEE